MGFLRPGDTAEDVRERDAELLDAAEELIRSATDEATRRLLDVALRVATPDADPIQVETTLGEEWARLAREYVLPAVADAWAVGALEDQDGVLTAAVTMQDRLEEYLANVTNRIVVGDGVQPPIASHVVERFREVTTARTTLGWGHRETQEALAREFLWQAGLPDLRDGLSAADADVDRLLDVHDARTRSELMARFGKDDVPDDVRVAVARRDRAARDLRQAEQALSDPSGRYQSQWERRSDRIARTEGVGAYNGAQYAQAQDNGDECAEWLCFLPSTRVAVEHAQMAMKRHYSGSVVRLTLRQVAARAGGTVPPDRTLTVTPNHPLLAAGAGWVEAREVQVGDDLLGDSLGDQWHAAGDPDVQNAPPTIAEVFSASAKVCTPERVVSTVVDFHSQAGKLTSSVSQGEVQVVLVNSELRNELNAHAAQCLPDRILSLTDVQVAALARDGASSLGAVRERNASPGDSAASGHSHAFVPVDVPADAASSGATAPGAIEASPSHGSPDGVAARTSLLCESVDAGTGQVAVHQVVAVKVMAWSGQVYDIQARTRWLLANGQIAHNSTYDSRVRDSHLRVDGTIVRVGEPFTLSDGANTAELTRPGDPLAPAAFVVNCRCSVLFGNCDDLADESRELAEELATDDTRTTLAQHDEPTPADVVDAARDPDDPTPLPARFDPDYRPPQSTDVGVPPADPDPLAALAEETRRELQAYLDSPQVTVDDWAERHSMRGMTPNGIELLTLEDITPSRVAELPDGMTWNEPVVALHSSTEAKLHRDVTLTTRNGRLYGATGRVRKAQGLDDDASWNQFLNDLDRDMTAAHGAPEIADGTPALIVTHLSNGNTLATSSGPQVYWWRTAVDAADGTRTGKGYPLFQRGTRNLDNELRSTVHHETGHSIMHRLNDRLASQRTTGSLPPEEAAALLVPEYRATIRQRLESRLMWEAEFYQLPSDRRGPLQRRYQQILDRVVDDLDEGYMHSVLNLPVSFDSRQRAASLLQSLEYDLDNATRRIRQLAREDGGLDLLVQGDVQLPGNAANALAVQADRLRDSPAALAQVYARPAAEVAAEKALRTQVVREWRKRLRVAGHPTDLLDDAIDAALQDHPLALSTRWGNTARVSLQVDDVARQVHAAVRRSPAAQRVGLTVDYDEFTDLTTKGSASAQRAIDKVMAEAAEAADADAITTQVMGKGARPGDAIADAMTADQMAMRETGDEWRKAAQDARAGTGPAATITQEHVGDRIMPGVDAFGGGERNRMLWARHYNVEWNQLVRDDSHRLLRGQAPDLTGYRGARALNQHGGRIPWAISDYGATNIAELWAETWRVVVADSIEGHLGIDGMGRTFRFHHLYPETAAWIVRMADLADVTLNDGIQQALGILP